MSTDTNPHLRSAILKASKAEVSDSNMASPDASKTNVLSSPEGSEPDASDPGSPNQEPPSQIPIMQFSIAIYYAEKDPRLPDLARLDSIDTGLRRPEGSLGLVKDDKW